MIRPSRNLDEDSVTRSGTRIAWPLPDKNAPSPTPLKAALDRLRRTHLEEGSVYCGLRSMVPIPAMGLVWIWVVKYQSSGRPAQSVDMLGSTVTVRHLILAIGILALWSFSLSLSPQRRRSIDGLIRAEMVRMVWACLVCGVLLFIVDLQHFPAIEAAALALRLALVLLTASAVLMVGAFCVSAGFVPSPGQQTALIIGSGQRADRLRAALGASNRRPYILGCLDDEYHGMDAVEDNYLGPLDGLAEILKQHPVEMVLIGLPVKSQYQQIQDVIAVCESVGVESHYMADVFATRATPQPSAHSRAFTSLSNLRSDSRLLVKRVMDITGSALLLVLASPLMLIAAVAIKLTSPGPILFVQRRYGLHRRQFRMFKFRTMQVDAEQRQASLEALNEAQGPVFKLKADPRITPIGSILRRSSIDELPQLLNVLLGEMSLVGPRPLPVRDVTGFEEVWPLRRFSVRPGLTCLWQVRGRSNISFDQWMELDLEYIDKWSILGDVAILAQTLPAVLKGSGAM